MQSVLRSVPFTSLLLLSAASLGACSGDDAGPALALGFATTAIAPTPSQLASKKVYMGAYGIPYVRWATSVHDAPSARAMALQSGHENLVVVVLDAPVLSEFFIRDVAQAVATRTGLTEDRVLVAATHSHSAPDLMGLWGGVPADYRPLAIDGTVEAAVGAWQARVPAVLEVSTGAGKAKNHNRRGWGFTDDTVVLLRAKDLDGKPLGALVNFAAHPTFLGSDNLEMSRDFCGYVVDAMERDLGAPVLYLNGAEGDVSLDFDGPEEDFAAAQAYGVAMAQIALGLPAGTEVREGLVVSEVGWEQTMDNSYFMLAERAGLLKEFELVKDGFFLKGTLRATYFRLGTALQVVSFPGEALTRTGLKIKESMQAQHKLLLGLTRGTLGYFVLSDEWKTDRNKNYEETVSPGPDAGDTAVSKLTALLEADHFTIAAP